MLAEILEGLTNEQKHALDELDIPKSRRSEWKSGRRRPTAAQAKTLAIVAGIDPVPLLQWLAEQEATPAQRGLFRLVMERAGSAILTVMFAVILSGGLNPESRAATSTYSGFDAAKQDIHCRVCRDGGGPM